MATITDRNLGWIVRAISGVAGDFAEIGVLRGATFKRLATLAQAQGKRAHAFDSFYGMDEPTAFDGKKYPKGRLSIGGAPNFIRVMDAASIPKAAYEVNAGFIPDCFRVSKYQGTFSFALVDVDHYAPTLAALEWIWPRLSSGAILLLDDYFPDCPARSKRLATRAITEWMAAVPEGAKRLKYVDTQLYVRKLNSG